MPLNNFQKNIEAALQLASTAEEVRKIAGLAA